MKYRSGFVSNSSTSSYIIAGIEWTKSSDELEQLILQHMDELISFIIIPKWHCGKMVEERVQYMKDCLKDGNPMDKNSKDYYGFRDDFYELFLSNIMHSNPCFNDERIHVGNVSCAIDHDMEIIDDIDEFIIEARKKLQILGLDSNELKVYHYAEPDC